MENMELPAHAMYLSACASPIYCVLKVETFRPLKFNCPSEQLLYP